jgi:hypothetical protein
MIRIVLAAGMLVIIGSMSALAQASGYKCTIKQSLQLEQDGSTQPHQLADAYRNKEFIVDRASASVTPSPTLPCAPTRTCSARTTVGLRLRSTR